MNESGDRSRRCLVICGSRHIEPKTYEAEQVETKLMLFTWRWNGDWVLIHGCCRGVDTICADLIKAENPSIEVVAFPADWSQGKLAGPDRNKKMLEYAQFWFSKIHLLAMPLQGEENKGTRDCYRQAKNYPNSPFDLHHYVILKGR